jgi:hypothetical protein
MDPDQLTPRQHLLLALDHYGIRIVEDRGRLLQLEREYAVEIETGFLFKLYWRNTVVAPFDQLDELCRHVLASG